MELSRKEEYRNQKVSWSVTIFSFIVMLVFFIYTNIITAGSQDLRSDLPAMTLGLNSKNTGDMQSEKIQDSQLSQARVSDTEAPYITGSELSFLRTLEEIPAENTQSEHPASDSEKTQDKTSVPVEGSLGKDPQIGFNLAERTIVAAPGFISDTQEEGKVVVDITVDRNGEVTGASPNGRGTTTSSMALKAAAKKMAFATKFNKNQKFEEQRGTITIIFTFN